MKLFTHSWQPYPYYVFGALPQSIKGAETRTCCTTVQQPKLCAEEADLHHREKTEMKLTLSVILATCALAVNGVSGADIKSGQRVGISIPYFNQWLGCAGQWCGRATCPQIFFSRPTTTCWGEVFYIYSEEANGLPIKVGDNVAVYYPRESKWMGCWENHCGKYTCPGSPTFQYGMSSAQKWDQCGGEVFTIYAFGRAIGEVIQNRDPIMLRFGTVWVSMWAGTTDKRTCPGYLLPPSEPTYDTCPGEAFAITQI